VLDDGGFLEDLIARARRGRGEDSAQVGDIHVARLGRYVLCFRLQPAAADYSFHHDVMQAAGAFAELVTQLQAGDLPPRFC
jgi:hypothetical protein